MYVMVGDWVDRVIERQRDRERRMNSTRRHFSLAVGNRGKPTVFCWQETNSGVVNHEFVDSLDRILTRGTS
jgi:hypothetical protein